MTHAPLLRILSLTLFTALGCSASHRPATVVRVGTSGDYAPFSIYHDDNFTGLDIDIMYQLGHDLGLAPVFVSFRWPDLIDDVRDGAFDIAASGITMRPGRALVGRYSRPYAVVGAVALIRQTTGPAFTELSTLDTPGVRIAVNAGGHLEQVAREQFPLALIIPVPNNSEVPKMVLDGSADAAISDSAEASYWLTPKLRVLGPFTHDAKAFLLPADDERLADRVDAWLVAREQDGWMAHERAQWLSAGEQMSAADMSREAVAALINLRLGLMPAVGAAKRAANLPIDDPAQEQRVLERVSIGAPYPGRIEAIYRVLIEMAKMVQRETVDEPPTASLSDLRAAIQRIDEQLVRELARTPPTPATEWSFTLERTWTVPGIDLTATTLLARALASPELRDSRRFEMPGGRGSVPAAESFTRRHRAFREAMHFPMDRSDPARLGRSLALQDPSASELAHS